MGLRVNFNFADIVMARDVSVKFYSEVLKGDADANAGDPMGQDTILYCATVTLNLKGVSGVEHTFDVTFNDKGACTLSADFNSWGDNREDIQSILDVTGIPYHVC